MRNKEREMDCRRFEERKKEGKKVCWKEVFCISSLIIELARNKAKWKCRNETQDEEKEEKENAKVGD